MATNMSPIDWAKRPLQKYADFTGRAPRAEFWWYTLGIVIAALVTTIIDKVLGLGTIFLTYGPLTLLLLVATLVPGIAVQVRRLHDTNKPGWWLLGMYVPYGILLALMLSAGVGAGATPSMGTAGTIGILSLVVLVAAIALLVFYCLPGTRGPNNYGPDPYGADVEQVFA